MAVGYRGMRRIDEAAVLGVAVSAGGEKSNVRTKRKSRQQAAWETALEGAPKRMRLQEHSTVYDLLFNGGKWVIVRWKLYQLELLAVRCRFRRVRHSKNLHWLCAEILLEGVLSLSGPFLGISGGIWSGYAPCAR